MNHNKIQREKEFYTYVDSYEFGFMSSLSSWEYNNPGKSISDYINFLENKHNIDYEKWKLYNPNFSRIDFGEYLYDKFENKLQ